MNASRATAPPRQHVPVKKIRRGPNWTMASLTNAANEAVSGGSAGDQRCRPTEETLQLCEVDAMAVKAKSPAEHGNHEADRCDAPAVVAWRGFVDCGKCKISRHRHRVTLSQRKPRSPTGTRVAPNSARSAAARPAARRRDGERAPRHRPRYRRDAADIASPSRGRRPSCPRA